MRSTLLLAALLSACPGKDTPPASPVEAPAADPAAQTVAASLDPQADPCDDFYRYACGGWLDATEIPGDQVRWGRSFSVIREGNQNELRSILEEAAAKEDKGQLGLWYSSCMDTDALDAAGPGPILADLASIGDARSRAALFVRAAELQRDGVNVFFGGGVQPDFKDPTLNILHLGQGGLGLPDRDYYLSEDPERVALRADYEADVARLLVLARVPEDAAREQSGRLLAFETELARISLPREDLRDPLTTYHRVERAGLKELAPSLDWDAFFSAMGAPDLTAISVETPAYFEQLAALIDATDLPTLEAYLSAHVVISAAPRLSEAFRQAHFDFFRARLAGQKERRPRWKECTDSANSALGELVGQEYVKRRFAGDSKAKALTMVQGIVSAFEETLGTLVWMDDTTRAAALDKARGIHPKIGYPDSWRDYSALALTDRWFDNTRADARFENAREVAKVGNPVDTSEWFMPPAMVNAYYNPLFAEIVFPAGILQPPFFSADFPPAMNYGAIGSVIGHELSHGFDDSGRKFDAVGRMRDWWDPAAAAAYEERAACVEQQYDGYELHPGQHVNGKLTLGENIADSVGVKQSFSAWLAGGGQDPKGASIVPGLDNEQLFFVSYAQAWCSKSTPQIEAMLLTVDPHSPSKFRVRGPLSDFDAFAEAFSCQPGDAMVREPACTVW